MGTAHPPHPTASIPKGMLKYATSQHISRPPPPGVAAGRLPTQFPGGLIDKIAAHKYLVREVRSLPQSVTVGGDSADSNLVLALTRYVVESQLSYLQSPGGLNAVSPSSEISFSRSGIGSSHFLNSKYDIFSPPPSQCLRPHHRCVYQRHRPRRNEIQSVPLPRFEIRSTTNSSENTKHFSGFPALNYDQMGCILY